MMIKLIGNVSLNILWKSRTLNLQFSRMPNSTCGPSRSSVNNLQNLLTADVNTGPRGEYHIHKPNLQYQIFNKSDDLADRITFFLRIFNSFLNVINNSNAYSKRVKFSIWLSMQLQKWPHALLWRLWSLNSYNLVPCYIYRGSSDWTPLT